MKKRPTKKSQTHVAKSVDEVSTDVGKEVVQKEPDTQTVKKHLEKTTGHVVDSLQELVEKNIKWSQVIYNQNKKINRRLTLMVVGNYIRLALILAPIIIGIIYLPSIISEMFEQYGALFDGQGLQIEDILNLFENKNTQQN